jgi:hypothetical protein
MMVVIVMTYIVKGPSFDFEILKEQ